MIDFHSLTLPEQLVYAAAWASGDAYMVANAKSGEYTNERLRDWAEARLAMFRASHPLLGHSARTEDLDEREELTR